MALLVLTVGDRDRFVSLHGRKVLGRSARCDVVLGGQRVSRAHCVIYREGMRWFLRDLGSFNGTRVNGERVRRVRELSNDDRIRIGGHILRFRRHSLSVPTPAPAPLHDSSLEKALILPPIGEASLRPVA